MAIFPLPDLAVLPGEVVSLHIFEPRYRRMIEDVLSKDYLLGVSLAGKVLHRAEVKDKDDPRDRNLNLYEPNTIFGCGPVILKERLEDGRLMIDLHVQHKVEVSNLVHSLPYYLADVTPIYDENEDKKLEEQLLIQLRQDFLSLAESIDANVASALAAQSRELDLSHLLILVLSVFRFPGDFKQQLLEKNSTAERVQELLERLPQLFPKITH